jgi:GH15 family glucan-1,4-alpha-glucosidase
MALTAAERQKRYRQHRSTANQGEGERRLNTWLSTAAFLALKRLAAHEDKSQREILERLILKADDDILISLRSNDEGFDTYITNPTKARLSP